MLEFPLGSLEPVKGEASGSGVDGGGCDGLDVVGDIVPDGSVG